MVKLIKINDRIWYSMYEEERDRPCLGYVRGDHWSLAVDAGHSDAHVKEFRYAGAPKAYAIAGAVLFVLSIVLIVIGSVMG